MKSIYILLASVLFMNIVAFSQQLSLNSQFSLNQFLINPAVTGNVDYIPIRLTARQQWIGINDAPSTQSISAHKLLNNRNMGIGGYIFMDRFGPESRMGVHISYSYIIELNSDNNTKLSLGVAAKAFQYKLDYNNLSPAETNDNLLSAGEDATFVPDADFGAYLYNNSYFVGLSVTQLIGVPVNLSTTDENKLSRHYYLLAGYKYKINDKFEVEPSVLLKATEASPMNIDFNVRGIYDGAYWLGISYRTSKTMSIILGIQYNSFVFGYAYDYSMSDIREYQSGTHEIIIGYNFTKKSYKGSSLM